jgi:hypothetical protein
MTAAITFEAVIGAVLLERQIQGRSIAAEP